MIVVRNDLPENGFENSTSVPGFLGRDPEDMGNLVGPLLSLNHIPSVRSTDSGHRLSAGVLPSVWVATHEDSLSVVGTGAFSMVLRVWYKSLSCYTSVEIEK